MQELAKRYPYIFQVSIHSDLLKSLARGTNQQFYCTGVIIFNKTRQLFFVVVSVDRHATYLGLK